MYQSAYRQTIKARSRLLVTALIGLLAAACASSPKTMVVADPNLDLSRFNTYGFTPIIDTDGNQYQSLETGFLKDSVSRELEARGFRKATDSTPDLLVNFSIETQEKVRSRPGPSMGYGAMYDPVFDDVYYGGWGMTHTTRIDQYTEGKLIIDLVDPVQRKLIWQGSTKGRLTQKDLENAQQVLDGAVVEIFTQFPAR